MKRYKTSAELKDLAKEKLTGRFGSAVFSLFLVSVVTRSVTSVAVSLLPVNGLFRNIISILFSAVVSAFLGILQTGIAYYFLNMSCNRPYTYGDIFYGFQENAEKSLKISAVHVAAETICLMPFQIFAFIFIETFDYKYILIAYILMLIGYIILTPINLAISQTFYLLLDFPETSAQDIIKTSIRIMKGHKWRLFRLDLSFLPLMIVCVLTLGIGFLWLNPYMRMTYTLFFLDLMNPGTMDSQNTAGPNTAWQNTAGPNNI